MENNRYVLDSLKRRNGQEEASQVISLIDSFPVSLENIDRALALQAGDVKSTAAISLADCFCTALAMKRSATVVTGDPEFEKVDGEIKIEWLPKKPKKITK
jgi:predicted nucleic acid-binding protein